MADRTDSEITLEPADSLTAAIPSVAGTSSTTEISGSMFDVHAPHEPINTWKSFFIHIATIVIGLLIAVGLEQTVEFFHHRHQRHELVEALQRNGEANRTYIEDDIAVSQGILDWALVLDDPKALEHFTEIVREQAAAHPGIKFIFSAK